MHIWQATWNLNHRAGEFLIWGENQVPSDTPFKQTSQISDQREVVPVHPFACSWEQLEKDLSLFDVIPHDHRFITITWPVNDQGPISSPKFITGHHLPTSQSPNICPLEPVTFPALALDPLSALSVLTILPDNFILSENFSPGFQFDDSTLYWVEVTKFLLELLTRGSFLPGLIRNPWAAEEPNLQGTSHLSCWHLVLSEPKDQERLQTLAENMPPLCRALRNHQPIHASAQAMLESFLTRSADVLIRTFLNPSPFEPRLSQLSAPEKLQTILRWQKSLTTSEATFHAPDSELLRFEEHLLSWSGHLLSPLKKHLLRMCFTLSSPAVRPSQPHQDSHAFPLENLASREVWLLEFSLQSTSDPRQSLSARDIWKGSLGFLLHSQYSLSDLEEKLLQNLGKACTLFPPLTRALQESTPTDVLLNTNEAYLLLRQTSTLFEKSGFGVILPPWWTFSLTSPGLRLCVSSPPNLTQNSVLGLQHLLEYRWEISLGEQIIDVEGFRKLAAQEVPLVQMNGRWIELPQRKINSTLQFLDAHKSQPKMRLIEALRLGSGVLGWEKESDSNLLPVVNLTTTGWLRQLLETSSYPLPKASQPANFHGMLRPYQEEGLSWLFFLGQLGIGGCLADDMGLGKTVQLLALLLCEREFANAEAQKGRLPPTLLIVPMSILDNWFNEAQKFAPILQVHLHHGPQRLTGDAFIEKVKQSDVIISTYSLAHRDEALFSRIRWGRIALDEAQNIKNLGTRQTQAIRRLSQAHPLLPETGTETNNFHRLALTGTPLENHLEELWSIFDFLNPGYLGSLSQFRTSFAVPIERYKDKDAERKLSDLVKPFLLRRLKSDPKVISELPEKIEMTEYTFLSREQALLYQNVLDGMFPQVEGSAGIHRKGLVLATITKLKQICDHPELFLKQRNLLKTPNLPALSSLCQRSGKLNRLEELLETILAEGDKTLIFTQYAQMGHLLQLYLQERFGKETLFLHGTLVRSARNEIVKRFQRDNGPQIFVLSLKVGGFGLNLTQANQVIHYDQWWNPAVEEQATDRAYRIGQKRNVQVRKLICKGTLEEKIASMLQQKRHLAHSIVGSTTSMVTEMSTAELKQLLQLNTENFLEIET